MSDPTARTLRLLSLLQRRRYWPGAELAARLEVSDRTLRRDVERLRHLGYTVESDRGLDGGYRLGGTAGDAALLLDDDETIALAAALHAAASGSTELAEASLGALTKVLSMLGPAQRQRAETVGGATSFADASAGTEPRLAVLDAAASACRDRVRLSFAYLAADAAATQRYVEPCGLVALDQRWYLVAYDLDRADWRTFRVDRMSDPVPSRNTFEPRPAPAPDLRRYVRFGLSGRRSPHRVVLDVDLPAEQAQARYGRWVQVSGRGAGACRLTMDVDSFDWPARIVTQLDAACTVVAPPALVDHLRAAAERLQACAERRPDTPKSKAKAAGAATRAPGRRRAAGAAPPATAPPLRRGRG